MKVICAWCKKEITTLLEKANLKVDNFPVSHGICDKCSKKVLGDNFKTVKEFLDGFQQQIMLVDNLNNSIVTNEAARKASGIQIYLNDSFKCGQIIGCLHAEEPQGCGATVHCSSCVIRKCILHTDKSGEPCIEVACPDEQFHKGDVHVVHQISTEKVGNRILLKIDPIQDET
jgi:hypothetical protein